MARWRASTTKSEWLPDDPTAFVPTKQWKSPCITTWDDSRNQNHPTDSAKEADFLPAIHQDAAHFHREQVSLGRAQPVQSLSTCTLWSATSRVPLAETVRDTPRACIAIMLPETV